MKYNQGFVSWSPRSLTIDTGGQGTIASSTGDRDFLNRCVGVQSHFVLEETDQTVSYLYYSQEFGNIIRLGMSPGKIYPGFERRNMLLHLLVPDEVFSWKLLWRSLRPIKFRRELSENEINSTELPAFYMDDAEYSDNIESILYKYGLDSEKKLALFLQETISVILGRMSAIAIKFDKGCEPDGERVAFELTALIAAAMPKPVGNNERYIEKLSFVVGSTRNAGTIKFVYTDQVDKDLYTLDLTKEYISSKTEEILSVFSVLARQIIDFRGTFSCLFEQLDNDEDLFWGELRNLLSYITGNSIEIADIDKNYHFWLMHEKKKRVHFEEIKDIYNELLIQTKANRRWYRNFLFEYLRQETELQQQSIIDLWKIVMRPAFIDRRRAGSKIISDQVWNEYLEIVFICMRFMYGKSRKNYQMFQKELPSENDWAYIQERLWDDFEDDKTESVIAREISEVCSVSDVEIFLERYKELVNSHKEVTKYIHLKKQFEEYKNATERIKRIKIHENLAKLGEEYWKSVLDDMRKYISESETEEEVCNLINSEKSRTEQVFVPDLYEQLIIVAQSLEAESKRLVKTEQELFKSVAWVIEEDAINKNVKEKKEIFKNICLEKRERAENRKIDNRNLNELLGLPETEEQCSNSLNFRELEFDSSRRKWAHKILIEIKEHKNELKENQLSKLISIQSDIISNIKQTSDETDIIEFYLVLWEAITVWVATMKDNGNECDYRQNDLFYKMKLQILRCKEGYDCKSLHDGCDIWREINRKDCRLLARLVNSVSNHGQKVFSSYEIKLLLKYEEAEDEVRVRRDLFRVWYTILNGKRLEEAQFEVLSSDIKLPIEYREEYPELIEVLSLRIKNRKENVNDVENLLILLSSDPYINDTEKCCEIYRKVCDDRVCDDKSALYKNLINYSNGFSQKKTKAAQFLLFYRIRNVANRMKWIDFFSNNQQGVEAYMDAKRILEDSDPQNLEHIDEYEALKREFEKKKSEKERLMERYVQKINTGCYKYEEGQQFHAEVVTLHKDVVNIEKNIFLYLERNKEYVNGCINKYNVLTQYDGEREIKRLETQIPSPEDIDIETMTGFVNEQKSYFVSNIPNTRPATETGYELNQDEECLEIISEQLRRY